ncbi:cytochrome c family protein [bacterium]|nr:cytochrome c family protein [bacterium]
MRKLTLMTLIALMAGVALVALAEGLPENITIKECADKKTPVEFPHKAHVDLKIDCVTCHHTSEGLTAANFAEMKVATCGSCHIAPEKAETPKCSESSKKTNPYHISCIGCHADAVAKNAESTAPTKCTACHPKAEG